MLARRGDRVMKSMNVAFCINDQYVSKVAVVMTSLLENHKETFFNFYIFSSDLSQDGLNTLNKLHLRYKHYAVKEVLVDAARFSLLKLNIEHISIETYYRYVMADLLPEVDKILYLDADLVVHGDIAPLYEHALGSDYLAGVFDIFISTLPHFKTLGVSTYINAGVLLMNLKAFREDGLGQKLIDATLQLKDKIQYQDQDVLNIVCADKIRLVDSIYNFAPHNLVHEAHKCKQAKIIHYAGPLKPWAEMSRSKQRKQLREVWWRYQKLTQKILSKKIRVALLIDEFFGGAGTAYGGYGFLARRYIAKYIPSKDIQVDVLLGRGKRNRFFAKKFHVDDVDLYYLPKRAWASKWWLKKQKYDIYLSIELTYDWTLKNETDPNKKLILWIQDPRPKYEWDEIDTVQLFKESCYYNEKIYHLVHDWNKKGRVRFVSQGYFLNQKAIDLYRLPASVPIQYLPNPVDIDNCFDVKHYPKKDRIIFLGRIESVKRGWLFCEIAKQLPEYEFYVLGQTFREKEKNASIMAQYQNLQNLHFVGHVDGEQKAQYLKDAKILVNTSIHEALPVSFLEALAYGVCLVSNRNPEALTEKFGVWTGQINGDGFDKVGLYVDAIKNIMTNESLRQELALAGRAYVEKIHNVPKFITDLTDVIYKEV